jgi:hypothetical protein
MNAKLVHLKKEKPLFEYSKPIPIVIQGHAMQLKNAAPRIVYALTIEEKKPQEKRSVGRVFGAMPVCPSVLLKRVQESATGYCFLL